MLHPRIALLNPNTDIHQTQLMLRSAQAALPPEMKIEGRTVPRGTGFIADEAAYEAATAVVVAYGQDLAAEGSTGS
jgi:Asp/Glu/hydantoin racemase